MKKKDYNAVGGMLAKKAHEKYFKKFLQNMTRHLLAEFNAENLFQEMKLSSKVDIRYI